LDAQPLSVRGVLLMSERFSLLEIAFARGERGGDLSDAWLPGITNVPPIASDL